MDLDYLGSESEDAESAEEDGDDLSRILRS